MGGSDCANVVLTPPSPLTWQHSPVLDQVCTSGSLLIKLRATLILEDGGGQRLKRDKISS